MADDKKKSDPRSGGGSLFTSPVTPATPAGALAPAPVLLTPSPPTATAAPARATAAPVAPVASNAAAAARAAAAPAAPAAAAAAADKLQRPADKLKAIRAAAQAEAVSLKEQIASLKRATITKYMDVVEELGESEVAAKLAAIDADIARAATGGGGGSSDFEVLAAAAATGGAPPPPPQLPKVLRDYAARAATLAAQLARAEHAAGNAEAAAIDERSLTVAAVVVDYRAPGNEPGDINVAAEARAARHVLEHVVLAQDGLIDEMHTRLVHDACAHA